MVAAQTITKQHICMGHLKFVLAQNKQSSEMILVATHNAN
jgi:hypothetical protein